MWVKTIQTGRLPYWENDGGKIRIDLWNTWDDGVLYTVHVTSSPGPMHTSWNYSNRGDAEVAVQQIMDVIDQLKG